MDLFAHHLLKHADRYRKDGWTVEITQDANGRLKVMTNIPLYQPSSFVGEFFSYKLNGTFLDVGAADGILWSNSLPLEETLGWKGVCVEPQLNEFTELRQSRKAITLNAAIHDSDQAAKYTFCQSTTARQISGFYEFFTDQHKLRIIEATAQSKGVITFQSVPCIGIEDAWTLGQLDYMSIDTEGSEWLVLSALAKSKVRPQLVSVEFNGYNTVGNDRCEQILSSMNYTFIKHVCNDRFYAAN
jgi:FkbM family methyltransferase